MDKYGMRGVGEIDLGQPRWWEDPTPVMQALQSYLQIEPGFAPDLLFEKGARAAEEAIERLAAATRSENGGRTKEKLVCGAARRVHLLLGARESPKFFAVRAMGIVHNILLEVGDEFASAGTIARPDDLFFFMSPSWKRCLVWNLAIGKHSLPGGARPMSVNALR